VLSSRTRAVSQAPLEAVHPSRWKRSPLRDLRPSRHAIVNQPSHATGTGPVKVATLGDSSLPAMRFRQLPGRRSADLSPGRPPLFRVGDRDPPVLRVAYSDATIFAADRSPCGKPSAASLGIFQRSPLRRVLCRGVHSRGRHRCPPLRDDRYHRFIHVPSPWFFATLTVSASSTLHVCCTVLPTMGFVVFRRACEAVSPPRGPALRSLLPFPGSFPCALAQRQRVSRHQTVAGLFTADLPSSSFTGLPRPHRCGSMGWHSWTSRVSSEKGFVAAASVSGRDALDTPLGLLFSLVTACAVRW
jgi:hypothetical protein